MHCVLQAVPFSVVSGVCVCRCVCVCVFKRRRERGRGNERQRANHPLTLSILWSTALLQHSQSSVDITHAYSSWSGVGVCVFGGRRWANVGLAKRTNHTEEWSKWSEREDETPSSQVELIAGEFVNSNELVWPSARGRLLLTPLCGHIQHSNTHIHLCSCTLAQWKLWKKRHQNNRKQEWGSKAHRRSQGHYNQKSSCFRAWDYCTLHEPKKKPSMFTILFLN